MKKYGAENYFSASSGGRSLRFTGEHIIGTSVQNPEFSLDTDYVRIKKEIQDIIPIKVDGYLPILETTPVETAAMEKLMSNHTNDTNDDKSLVTLFANVAGIESWRKMISSIRL